MVCYRSFFCNLGNDVIPHESGRGWWIKLGEFPSILFEPHRRYQIALETFSVDLNVIPIKPRGVTLDIPNGQSFGNLNEFNSKMCWLPVDLSGRHFNSTGFELKNPSTYLMGNRYLLQIVDPSTLTPEPNTVFANDGVTLNFVITPMDKNQ